ncbi:MAG: polyphosphate polymerase domain-containing protein [Lachnospiraceae bacterium]|nr:polyphosphate polymerase domain-containing protein [Lachnospiraceae bacterium]
MDYRVENKYIVDEAQIEYLKVRLSECMKADAHGDDGSYLIRSVYFDDMYDTALQDTIAGVDNRFKYRIRTYDNDTNVINLELKKMIHGYKHKDSTALTKEEANLYINGQLPAPKKEDEALKKEFYSYISCNNSKPKIIVEYERTALVERIGNVRITFDKNIGACSKVEAFYDKIMPVVPVMEEGYHILEVKYDELLPDYILRILKEVSLSKTSYSKYYQARLRPTLGELI